MKRIHVALRSVATAALLSTLTVPSLALTQANLSLGSFSYGLKDLNASDGLTPALNWKANSVLLAGARDMQQSGWTLFDTYLYGYWQDTGSNDRASETSLDLSSPLGQAWSSGSINGDAPAVLSVGTSVLSGFGGNAYAQSFHAFTLSANTQLTLSFELSGELASNGSTSGWIPSPYGPLPSQEQSTTAYTAAVTVVSANGGNNHAMISGSANSWWSDVGPYELIVDGQRLQLTVSNKSTAEQDFDLRIYLQLQGRESLAPVPEPATYALAALGLVAVGAAKRRRA